ncbi:MAG: fasciclin domain-containing protein [Rhizobiales bacterium]|nr:fasciclin domain-containing protein [Hyphomicrobiales bacterium]
MVAQAGTNGSAKTIVDTAKEAGQFGTLLQAAEAAGLVDTLNGDGPFTIFAPTDDAFAQLPEGKLDELLKPENRDQLADILTFHVVADEVTAEEMAGQMKKLTTVQGGMIDIDSAGRMTKIEHASIIQPDIEASNGVIHVIDQVIMPN